MTIRVLPNRLILLSFKYVETRALRVDEKSEYTDFGKEIVLIIKSINYTLRFNQI